MLNKIFSVKKENFHTEINILGLKIKIKNKQKELLSIIHEKSFNIEKKINLIFKNITPKPYLTNFTVDISHHCNLNCKGCDHFSPLAEPGFYDLKEFKNDMSRLSELTDGFVDRIGIMGGEPLLNPDVLEYLKITRNYFPNTKIRLVTNGILLPQQKEEFWLTLKNLNIFVEYTKYDINLDYAKLDQIIKKYEVPIEVYGYNKDIIKTSYKAPLDLKGNQDVVESFLGCYHANHCITLKSGRLYTCTVAPYIEYFNKYFNKNIPLTNRDSVNIYEAENIKEILEFLAKPIPFCKYCNVKGRTFGHKWSISKKDISEWTIGEVAQTRVAVERERERERDRVILLTSHRNSFRIAA